MSAALTERQTSEIRWLGVSPSDEGTIGQRRFARSPATEVLAKFARQRAEVDARLRETYLEIRKHFVPQDDSVRVYLSENALIAHMLLESVPYLKNFFGADAVLSLRAPLDEAGSRSAVVVVMWPGGLREVRAALARFDDHWWIERATQSSSLLTFTYELI